MSVVINAQTGLAENLPDDQAQQALQAGTHNMPLVDAQGEVYSAPYAAGSQALANGQYSQPNQQQLQNLMNYATYSTPEEQAKSVGEGIIQGVLPFGIGTAIEAGLGASPEAMRGRAQVNPGEEMAGQIAGLAGSLAVPGVGQAEVLGRAGEAAAALTGLGATADAGLLSKAAAEGVSQFTEMALMQSGNEVAKMIQQDPDQSMSSAIANVGLAGAVGGLFGLTGKLAVEPLWEATKGSKLGSMLTALRSQVNNVATNELINKTGLDIPPEVVGAVSNPDTVQMASHLLDTGTHAGQKMEDAINGVREDIGTSALAALGRTPEDVGADLSENQIGTEVKTSLAAELQDQIQPVIDQFEPLKEQTATMPVSTNTLQQIGEQIGKLSVESGANLSESSPINTELNRVLQDLPNIKTVADLGRYQTVARANIGDLGGYSIQKKVVGILRDGEQQAIQDALQENAPDLVTQLQASREAYKGAMNTIDSLNDRLHVGPYQGPKTFLNALNDMTPENVLRRLQGTKDADLLQILSQQFPNTAERMRQYTIDKLINASQLKGEFNTARFFTNLAKMSPEMRAFITPEEKPLDAVERLRDIIGTTPNKESAMVNKKSIERPHFIFSADEPRVSKDMNLDHETVLAQLKESGYDAHEVQGHYGKPERSIVVNNVTPEEAEKLFTAAQGLGQESAIYSNGAEHEMRYLNGDNVGKSVYGKGTQFFKEKPEDFYTEFTDGSGYFSHNFDFDKMDTSRGSGVKVPPHNFSPADHLDRLRRLLHNLPKPENISRTAKHVNFFNRHLMGGIGAIVGYMAGHPFLGFDLGEAAGIGARELPAQLKLSYLKALGSREEVNAGAFRSMFKTIDSVYKNVAKQKTLINHALKHTAHETVQEEILPTNSESATLDKLVRLGTENPEAIANVSKDLAHYMPEHSSAFATIVGRAIMYLRGIEPNTEPIAPLDQPRKVSQAEQAAYSRQLAIVNRPNNVLVHLANGTLQPRDVQTLQAVYPSLYAGMKNTLMEALVNNKGKGPSNPRLHTALSLFMGSPASASTMPQNIMANQAIYQPTPAPQQRNIKASRAPKSEAKAIQGLSNMYSTPNQSREQARLARK